MSCILDGGVRQEKFYIFTGSGSNSKSLLLNLIQHAIGEYYCILPIALLTQKRTASNNAQSELERTRGRRLAVMQEPGESEKLNIGLMKELSGGDRIICRGLFKEPIEFRPQFKMVMTCNELPEVPSDDGGTWRRIRVIEHTSKFTDAPNPNNPKEFHLDIELNEKIERWADTLISMLIDHHKTIDPKNIVEPAEVRIATEMYRKQNDNYRQFVDEAIAKCPKSVITLQELYGVFRE
jgi:P4 family phage/plasmid primase-like protien